MPQSVKALVTPSVLAWARRSAGVSVEHAAARAKVPPDRIVAWESSDEDDLPTVAQLRKLASLYQRPLAAFYLPAPPAEPGIEELKDFRQRSGADRPDATSALRLAVRRAHEQREIALELSEALDEPLEDVPYPREITAEWVRSWLSVTDDLQKSWASSRDHLAHWIEAVEAKGVLVIQYQFVDPKECSGFALALRPAPVIALNVKESKTARLFTLLHELAHVLSLREHGSLCTVQRKVERDCNALAASVLMPAPLVRAEFERAGGTPQDRLLTVARRLGVSPEAMSYRFGEIGLPKVKAPPAGMSSGGRLDNWRKQVRNLGRSYVRLVLEAHARGNVSTNEALGLVNVRLRDIPKVRNLVA